MMRSPNQELFSLSLIRLVGYGLMVLTLVDFIFIIFPLRLMDPAWELQTIGAFVERIPIPLLGMAFIFFGERTYRAPIETLLLKWLSWLSLMLTISFFLMVPLGINDTIRVSYNNNARVNSQVLPKIDEIRQFKGKLNEANSPDQIRAIVQKQTSSGNIATAVDTEKLKNNILQELKRTEENLRSQAEQTRSGQHIALLKNATKWNLGALIASCLFFFIWKDTLWARLEQNVESGDEVMG
jgi:hypothetical protein